MKLRIGTRGSRLAMWQAEYVAGLLQAAGADPEIVIVRTTGDRRTDVPLSEIGGKGMFVKELEEALSERRVDLAVHSLKDVPSFVPEEMVLAAFPDRDDPRDAWLHPQSIPAGDLPAGAVVATGSPRRAAQIRDHWPHLSTADIRGNVDTRLRHLLEGRSAAMILAMAGLKRLGLAGDIRTPLDPEVMVPAAGQGVLVLEALRDRPDVVESARAINDSSVEREALTERRVLELFGRGLDCHSAIGVHARHDGAEMEILAFAGGDDRRRTARSRIRGQGADSLELAARIHEDLVRQGAVEILGLRDVE